MRHIRYISTNTPICVNPAMLDYDNIVVDFVEKDESYCRTCSDLLMASNMRLFEREQRSTIFVPQVPASRESPTMKEAVVYTAASVSSFWIGFFTIGDLYIW